METAGELVAAGIPIIKILAAAVPVHRLDIALIMRQGRYSVIAYGMPMVGRDTGADHGIPIEGPLHGQEYIHIGEVLRHPIPNVRMRRRLKSLPDSKGKLVW